MPELAEVETIKRVLRDKIVGKTIASVSVYYPSIIAYPKKEEFERILSNKTIIDMKRRGKWLLFDLEDYYLLSHLRMEGRYFLRSKGDVISKHDHVDFCFQDGTILRYHDTRKFGRMYLYKKEEAYKKDPLLSLGYEPWDPNLTVSYLKEKYKRHHLPIKTVLLDQRIMVGIGNIYADEILAVSKLDPFKRADNLTNLELDQIIQNTKKVLEQAILMGGTTIRTYEATEGVHGRFQQELFVHGKENCRICNYPIEKAKIGGRTTYYCPKCQKKAP